MKSAGQINYGQPGLNPYAQAGYNPYAQPYGGIGGYPGYPGLGYPGGLGAGAMFQPVTLGPAPRRGGGTTTKIDVNMKDLDEKTRSLYAWGNIAGDVAGSISDTLHTGLNYALAGSALEKQVTIATQYYATQQAIAGMQSNVANGQIRLQDKAVDTQYKMYKDQIVHERTLARLEGSTQARLARIAEDGKLARLEVISTASAFSRRGWDMGLPKFDL